MQKGKGQKPVEVKSASVLSLKEQEANRARQQAANELLADSERTQKYGTTPHLEKPSPIVIKSKDGQKILARFDLSLSSEDEQKLQTDLPGMVAASCTEEDLLNKLRIWAKTSTQNWRKMRRPTDKDHIVADFSKDGQGQGKCPECTSYLYAIFKSAQRQLVDGKLNLNRVRFGIAEVLDYTDLEKAKGEEGTKAIDHVCVTASIDGKNEFYDIASSLPGHENDSTQPYKKTIPLDEKQYLGQLLGMRAVDIAEALAAPTSGEKFPLTRYPKELNKLVETCEAALERASKGSSVPLTVAALYYRIASEYQDKYKARGSQDKKMMEQADAFYQKAQQLEKSISSQFAAVLPE